MKERPILFSAPMIRAILENRKTQTRRVMKNILSQCASVHKNAGAPHFFRDDAGHFVQSASCPYGQPGDRLWVRETWKIKSAWKGYQGHEPDDFTCAGGVIEYAAGGEFQTDDLDDKEEETLIRFARKSGFNPSIHMPRWASRINLEITGVRVERLQDIREHDAMAEGVSGWATDDRCETARDGFHVLWESINGVESWAVNPWVWVVEFKQLEGGKK